MTLYLQNSGDDCFITCIACLFDLPVDNLPILHLDNQVPELNCWLKGENLYYLELVKPVDNDFPDWVFTILIGKSPRGDFNHAVIGRGLNLFWDPHPEHTGIENIERVGVFIQCFDTKYPLKTAQSEREFYTKLAAARLSAVEPLINKEEK